jgi:hypothetical protein
MSDNGLTSRIILYKTEDEKKSFGMDFSNKLTIDGDRITGIPTITWSPTDDLVVTYDYILDNIVYMDIENGAAYRDYKINIVINTASGNILEGIGCLKIRNG